MSESSSSPAQEFDATEKELAAALCMQEADVRMASILLSLVAEQGKFGHQAILSIAIYHMLIEAGYTSDKALLIVAFHKENINTTAFALCHPLYAKQKLYTLHIDNNRFAYLSIGGPILDMTTGKAAEATRRPPLISIVIVLTELIGLVREGIVAHRASRAAKEAGQAAAPSPSA